jgi:chromosome segregation ATPase
LLSGVILVSGTWFVGWVNRKRSSTVKAEDNKLEAEAISLNIKSLADLYEQARSARAEIAAMVQRHDATVREYVKETEFLREQIEIKTESEFQSHEDEKKVRARFHAAANEIQRCILRVRDYEEMLRSLSQVFTPFDFTPYEELMQAWKHEDAIIRRS